MFSEAYTNLNQALRQARSNNPNFQNIRSLLKSAVSAVYEDPNQSDALKREAVSRIESAISYTYSRTNPMPSAFSPQSFASMMTPISPFQRNTMGPYGFVQGPMIPAHPQLTPTAWTGQEREKQSLILMIQGALNVVRKGL